METALLVIDAQKAYTERESGMFCQDSRETVNRINRLIESFQKTGSPVVLCRHMYRADGSDLGRMYDYLGEVPEQFSFKKGTRDVEYDDRLDRPDDAAEIVKNRYSAFVGTGLEELLRERDIRRVVVCGFMTNFCCESTARDAHDRDYFVDFVVDATGTPGTANLDEESIRGLVAELLEAGFARIVTTQAWLETATGQ